MNSEPRMYVIEISGLLPVNDLGDRIDDAIRRWLDGAARESTWHIAIRECGQAQHIPLPPKEATDAQ